MDSTLVARICIVVCLVCASREVCRATATVQTLGARSATAPAASGGNADSIAPVISGDGRFVVFSSAANNLVPGDNCQPGFDVFLRDRASNSTVLVSASCVQGGGGNGSSVFAQLSTNGQLVAFQSDASDLVPRDTNASSDIFVRGLPTGAIQLVSAGTNGSPANGASWGQVMTPNGRYVVFISSANNLVANDTNGIADIFLRDLQAGTTTMVSLGAVHGPGVMTLGMPAVSPDGRFVAFFSTAMNMVPGAPIGANGEVYLCDLATGQISWASTNASTLALAALGLRSVMSYHPAISSDGRYLAFKTGAVNPTNAAMILVYDSVLATTTVISSNSFPVLLDQDDPYGPEMTPDGRYIAYVQHEGSVATGYCSVHLWDLQTATDILASGNGGSAATNATSRGPIVSPDGRFVTFLSSATNLVPNPLLTGFHIYIRDLQSGTTSLVDADLNGIGSTDNDLSCLSMSANGRWIAFSSPDGNLAAQDFNGASDVFVRDTSTSTTELISAREASVHPPTGAGSYSISERAVSANGRCVVFSALSDELAPNHTNHTRDVYLCDSPGNSNILVSVLDDGSPARAGFSGSAVVSATGRFVAFISTVTNLIAGRPSTNANVYLRDIQNATTSLVSVSTNGVACGNGDSFDPVISRDGRYVAFVSTARNLAPGITSGVNTFWRDTVAKTNVALAGPNYYVCPPSMSADGRYLAYFSGSPAQLRVRDMQTGKDVYTNTTTVTAAALSPTGKRLLYRTSGTVSVVDVVARTSLVSFSSPVTSWSPSAWSADGGALAGVARTNNVSNLYVWDFVANTVTLFSPNYQPVSAATASSDSPVMSADGRFVTFRSYATNLVVGAGPAPNLYLYDRAGGTTIALTAGQTGSGPVVYCSKPVLSADGSRVAFAGFGAGLVAGDLNRETEALGIAMDTGASVDSDGDGIPNWWMDLYFGHPTAQAGDSSRAQDDADGDGLTNLQEWLAGTSPTDATSTLRLVAATAGDSGIMLTWQSVSGTSYFVQRNGDLISHPGFVSIQSNIVGRAGVTSFTVTNGPPGVKGFYRVGVQQ